MSRSNHPLNLGDRHYTVDRTLKIDTLMLPDNFAPSKQRLESLVKRLKRQPAL